jgi:predicted tellurium resistance membrane protein TerC
MEKSKFIGAAVLILIGFGLSLIGLSSPVALIYGLPILIVGIAILFNKKEDKIEQINYSKLKGRTNQVDSKPSPKVAVSISNKIRKLKGGRKK